MSSTVTSREAHEGRSTATGRRSWRRLRFVPLGVGAAAMASGFWLGLARLGIELPGGLPPIAEFHGALMIGGFLGTLISLERAVAMGRPWSYAAPALAALGTVALLADAPHVAGLLFLAASAVLVVASVTLFARQVALFTFILILGAAAWSLGTIQWLAGEPMPVAAGWWLTFLILTITAERLELSRLITPPPWSRAALSIGVILILFGAARGELAGNTTLFTSVGLLACAAWLLHHDVARRTIRKDGQIRFSAACLLAGHAWLAVAGGLGLVAPPGAAAFSYDAVIHAVTIGFVLSMIFGHAPIILPAVTGLRVRYHAFAYAPLALLHASVALRVGSDLAEWVDGRKFSGLMTVLALAGYAATLIVSSARRRRAPG